MDPIIGPIIALGATPGSGGVGDMLKSVYDTNDDGVLDVSVIPDLALSKISDAGSAAANDTGDFAAASHTHVEADITDLGSYLTSVSMGDVATLTALGDGEVLVSSSGVWINNTLAEAGIAAASHTHVEADITDLGSYLTSVAMTDVATITAIASGEVLKWNGSAWINNTLAEAGIAAASHTHAASAINSGEFADARISESSVAQHQAALDILSSNLVQPITGVSAECGDGGGGELGRVSLASASSLACRGYSFAFWIYFHTIGANKNIAVWESTSGGGTWEIALQTGAGPTAIGFSTNGGGGSAATWPTGSITGSWHHIGFTVNASTGVLTMYFDGSNLGGAALVNNNTWKLFELGGGFGANDLDGMIAHPAEWNSVLTDANFAALANGTNPTALSATRYWGDLSGASPHAPTTGSISLTETGTVGDGASDPSVYGTFTPAEDGHTHTESDITDLQSYLTSVAMTDVATVTDVASGEVMAYSGAAWVNQTLAEANIEPASTTITGVSADCGDGAGTAEGYLTCTTHSLSTRGYSFACWVNWHTYANNKNYFEWEGESGGGTWQVIFQSDSSTGNLKLMTQGGGTTIEASAPSTEAWHHLGFTVAASDGTATMYLDGSAIGATAIVSDDTLKAISLGGYTGNQIDGMIAHPAEWARVLSATDFAALAAGLDPKARAPWRYWDDLTGASPHSPVIGAGDMAESGTVGDGASSPTVYTTILTTDDVGASVQGRSPELDAINAIFPTKGKLLVGNGTTWVALAPPTTNDHVLVADSSEATGMKWAAVPGA